MACGEIKDSGKSQLMPNRIIAMLNDKLELVAKWCFVFSFSFCFGRYSSNIIDEFGKFNVKSQRYSSTFLAIRRLIAPCKIYIGVKWR